jgi:hypothetical protein
MKGALRLILMTGLIFSLISAIPEKSHGQIMVVEKIGNWYRAQHWLHGTWSLIFYDEKGKEIWRLKDDMPQPVMNPDGTYALYYHLTQSYLPLTEEEFYLALTYTEDDYYYMLMDPGWDLEFA